MRQGTYLTIDERRYGVPHVKSAGELERNRDRAAEARRNAPYLIRGIKRMTAHGTVTEAELRAMWGDR